MAMRIALWASMFAFLVLISGPTSSQPSPSQVEWINALRNGGFVVVFSYGTTDQDQIDTAPPNPTEIGSQRHLNDLSGSIAKSIGESLSKLRIPVGQVHTNLFRRAIDTGASMGLGEVKAPADYTEGGLVLTPIGNDRRAAALRKIVATVPAPGTNIVVVTHRPDIMGAFGKDWFDIGEGEASVFKPDGSGGYKAIVRIQADVWSELAHDADSLLNSYDLN
jgi:hypothetical protein